jgi:hypothetical protein
VIAVVSFLSTRIAYEDTAERTGYKFVKTRRKILDKRGAPKDPK